MSDIYNRAWKVTIIEPQGVFEGFDDSWVGAHPEFFDVHGNASEITELRIAFDIKRDLSNKPNNCKLKIWNLSPFSRAALDKFPIKIMIAAGYAGAPRLLFVGDKRWHDTQPSGPDMITEIHIGDGSRAFKRARISRSYKPPIRVETVLRDAAKSMGLELPPELERSAELRQALATGISVHGPTREVLTQLLAPYGYGWSVQNGRLQIIKDEQIAQIEERVIDADAGLIGSPKWTAPTRGSGKSKKSRGPQIDFDVALYPELTPGGRVHLKSERVDGRFKIVEVQDIGDSTAGPWKTSVKARPV